MTEIEFLLYHIVYCDMREGGKEMRWRRSQRKVFTRSMNSSISSVIQIVMFRPMKEGQKLYLKSSTKIVPNRRNVGHSGNGKNLDLIKVMF